jgi:hypothetical protein
MPGMPSLDPTSLTWTALLGRWLDFARASVALPDDAEGACWRDSVVPIINLQAVTFALRELGDLPAVDRPYGRDRAEVLIREHAGLLNAAWRGIPMAETLIEIVDDARTALDRSIYAGAVEFVHEGDDVRIMPAVDMPVDRGTLAVMQPGTLIMPAEPMAWIVEADAEPLAAQLPDAATIETSAPRQVYRQFDDDGRAVRDCVTPIWSDPPPGLPLLVPLCAMGEPVGRFTVDPDAWLAHQQQAIGEAILPVAFTDDEA